MSAEEDVEAKRQREEQEEAEFELSKQQAMDSRARRPSIADEMQDFLKGASRARSNSIDNIKDSIDSCRQSVALVESKSAKLNSGCEELQYELEMQGKLLNIIARMRESMDRKKKLNEMTPKARMLLVWARGIGLQCIVENYKIQLHGMGYDKMYSCYKGIDWRTGKPLQIESMEDSLSQLCDNSNNQAQASVSTAAEPTAGSGSTSVLANAGSSALLGSQSSPRISPRP
jgi:hypothetical protein